MYVNVTIAMPYVCNEAARSLIAGHQASRTQHPASSGDGCKRGSGLNGVVAVGTIADPHRPPTPLIAAVPHLRLLRSIPLKRFLANHPPCLPISPPPRGIYKICKEDANVLTPVYTTCERSQKRLNYAYEQTEGTGLYQEPHQTTWCFA